MALAAGWISGAAGRPAGRPAGRQAGRQAGVVGGGNRFGETGRIVSQAIFNLLLFHAAALNPKP